MSRYVVSRPSGTRYNLSLIIGLGEDRKNIASKITSILFIVRMCKKTGFLDLEV